MSIPALHREVSEWTTQLEADGGSLDVDWAALGFPEIIELDLGDGEKRSLDISFRNLASAYGESSIRVNLAEARSLWSDADIRSYRLEVTESRNYWSNGCTWITVVTDGVVTEVANESAASVQGCFETERTIEQLHDQISTWADSLDLYSDAEFGQHTLEATFNEIGVPQRVEFDLANGSDEESLLSVTFKN